MKRTPADQARHMLAMGIVPIQVPYKSKAIRRPGWPDERTRAEDIDHLFGSGQTNIGMLMGEPSGWVVDIDLDHDLAVELADKYLPPTPAVFGRPSSPRSHRLYRITSPCETRKWSSKTAGMIVELRSTGTQTIGPGSVHPTGESVEWAEGEDGEPAEITPEELVANIEDLVRAVKARHGESSTNTQEARPTSPARSNTTPYGRSALNAEAAEVAGTAQGGRNDRLNKAAFSTGQLVGGGEIEEATAVDALQHAARECGLGDSEARATIASGLNKGMQSPRSAPRRRGDSDNTLLHGIAKGGAGTVTASTVVLDFIPFPVDVLPEPIRGFILDGAKAIGCDASYIALPLLSALGSAIGNTHRIELKHGWTEPPILWTAIVGESGTMKTPAFKLAMKAIRKAQDDAFKEYSAELTQWESDSLLYEAELNGWKRNKAKSHGDAGDPPEKPAPPVARRYIVSDTTTEALAPILLGNPRGVLLARDELAGWLRHSTMERRLPAT